MCCCVMWCDVTWCDVMCCCVMWCAVVWCDVTWRGVMWCDVLCDVMWHTRVLSACNTVLFHFICGCNAPVYTTAPDYKPSTMDWEGQGDQTTKGRSIHSSSRVMDIGWQQWKVSLVHFYEWRNNSTSIAFIFQVSVTVLEFMWALSFKI